MHFRVGSVCFLQISDTFYCMFMPIDKLSSVSHVFFLCVLQIYYTAVNIVFLFVDNIVIILRRGYRYCLQ